MSNIRIKALNDNPIECSDFKLDNIQDIDKNWLEELNQFQKYNYNSLFNIYYRENLNANIEQKEFEIAGILKSDKGKDFKLFHPCDKLLILCVFIDRISNPNNGIDVTVEAFKFDSVKITFCCFAKTTINYDNVSNLQVNFDIPQFYSNKDSIYDIADIIVSNGNKPNSTISLFSIINNKNINNTNNNDYKLQLDKMIVKMCCDYDGFVYVVECN